jgi:hypothetical protein
MTISKTWGQIFWLSCHGVKPLRLGRCFVALKMEKAVASMERTIRLQAKLIPRRNIFATRTRSLTFCSLSVDCFSTCENETYQIFLLLLVCRLFPLLEDLLFPEGRAEDHRLCAGGPWRCARRLQCAPQWGLWRRRRKVLPVGLLHLDGLDVAEAHVRNLGLRLIVVRRVLEWSLWRIDWRIH